MTGTATLLRLALRRDRVALLVWLLILIALVAANVSGYHKLYPTDADLTGFARSINVNPTELAVYGPVYGPSLGGLVAWRMTGIQGVVLIALMNIFTVVRHTRADEESGRLELVGAGAVGRGAALSAALLAAAVADLAFAGYAVLILALRHTPVVGAVTFGLGLAAVGFVFAAVAAVTAQLAERSRVAIGSAIGVVVAFWLLRAVGDGASPVADRGLHVGDPGLLSWLSPFGWAVQLRAYAGNRLEIFALFGAAAVLLVGVAFGLAGRRDLGAGLVPARPGRPHAGTGLRGSFGLAWRLQRGLLLAWTVAFATLGVAVGLLANGIADVFGDNGQLTDIIADLGGTRALLDSYFGAILGILGILAGGYGVQTVLRIRGEETAQHAEPVLATGVSRPRWAGAHLAIAVLGSAVPLAVGGLAAGLAYTGTGASAGWVGRLAGAALVQLPAVAVVAGVAAALVGSAPRLASLAWGVLAVFVLLGQFGPVFTLSQPALDVSPYSHLPKLPAAALTATPLLSITAAAVVLFAFGLVTLRRRDILTG